MNNLTITGRLVRDPEIRFSASGTAVCKGCFAWDDPYLKKKQDANAASFFDFVMFGATAENFAKYFKKGDPVMFTGSIQQERWENAEGEKRSKVVLKIFGWEFPLKPRKRDDEPAQSQPKSQKAINYTAKGPHMPVEEDDIPF